MSAPIRRLAYAPVEQQKEHSQHTHTDKNTAPAIAVERNAEQSYSERKRDIAKQTASLVNSLPHSPKHHGDKHEDVHNHTRIESESEHVDKQQLKPSSDLDNARHNTIEYGSNQGKTATESNETTLKIGIAILLVVPDEYQRWQAEQIEQMHTDREPREVSDEYNPTIRVRLVGMLFPFEHKPEYQGGKQA